MQLRAIAVGLVSGGITAWLGWSTLIPDPVAFHTVSLAAIGAIYIGFAFADGRISIMILENIVATVFVVLAFLGLWQAPVLIAAGLVLHGIWDLVHRPNMVKTKIPNWYPPFCASFDFVFAGVYLVLARSIATHAS